MTMIGVVGLVVVSVAVTEGGYLLFTGIVLAIAGFYSALAHYLVVKIYEKKGEFLSGELLKFLKPRSRVMVLDIGSGTGRTAIAIGKSLQYAKVVGIDIYSTRTIYGNSPRRAYENAKLENVRDRVFFNYGSAFSIPFKDQSFDVVTASSVLHLFREAGRKRAIVEILRVLKGEGRFVVIEMTRTVRLALFYWVSTCFVFQTKAYWIKLLMENGFKNIETTKVGDMAIFCAQKPK